ncbi:PEP-CTERM sorting domain-containing protein [uncultured Nostoc sp.]|uniref:PEP-CTERM sorting domain-containing protein n=1 Tax=uncultured Nostoc sp. TaxID=340711 RepID=UPI003459C39E
MSTSKIKAVPEPSNVLSLVFTLGVIGTVTRRKRILSGPATINNFSQVQKTLHY